MTNKRKEAGWVVIHMAHTQQRAEQIERLLDGEGFLIRVRPVARALSGDSCFEVLSLSSEAKEARDLLQERGFV